MKIHLKLPDIPQPKVRAKVIDKALVLALNEAQPPAVLRFELERLHAVSFLAQESGGQWQFGLTGPKGEFTPAAILPDAAAAQRAVRAAMRALLHAPGGLGAVLMRRGLTLLLILVTAWLVLGIVFGSLAALLGGGAGGPIPAGGSEMGQAAALMEQIQQMQGGGGLPGAEPQYSPDTLGQPLPADKVLQVPE